MPSASLAPLLATRRVIVCVGSGGVGKTTTSAALAAHAARSGRRVLCLTIDPAKRLASSLGLEEMTTELKEVPAALFAEQGLAVRGQLFAMMLDTKLTFDELVVTHAPSPDAARRILENPIYQYVAGSLAGTREYMAMEKLHAVRADPQWDLIVLDTPPTSNALDFLDAPERLAGILDSPALGWLARAIDTRGRFSWNLLQRGATKVLEALASITGSGFLERVAEFVSGMVVLFGGFRERAARVAAELRGPDVAFVLVTSPRHVALAEAKFFAERLAAAGIPPAAVVVNGVHPTYPPFPLPPDRVREALLSELEPAEVTPALVEQIERVYAEERFLGESDRAMVDRMLAGAESVIPRVEVPAFDEDVHDLAGLAAHAAYLTGEATPPPSQSRETA